MTIIAVTGLAKEAEIVGVADVVAVAGGGDSDGLKAKLNALHGDIRGVISIGLAGALSPHLKVGDCVIADRIMTGAESWDCHAGWKSRLASRLALAHQGALFGSDVIIEHSETKAGLHTAHRCPGGRHGSQVAARFAASRNLPLAGLRVISRRCQPCAAAGRPGGDETRWRHRARPRVGIAAEKAKSAARADPHGAGLEQGLRGTTPLASISVVLELRHGSVTSCARHDGRR